MFKLAYCDKIADTIRRALKQPDPDHIIAAGDVRVEWDLDEQGAFRSPAKTLTVYDVNGKCYKITVQEFPLLDK